MAASRSAALFERAREVLVGGVSRNTLLRAPHPLYAARASGCRVVDVEGVERLDIANNMASLIHGHAHPAIVEAVSAQLARGSAFTLATEVEIAFAEHLCGRSPGFDKVRFVNSGTEAVMAALKAARAYTGRARIAKVEGTYHGAYDYAEVSQQPTPEQWGEAQRPTSVALAAGTPASVAADVVVLPFNDPAAAIERLDALADEIACVLLDPMPHRVGFVPASGELVGALRRWTERAGALLVFDEVITFRTEVGGMQARYGVTPDLTAMGKIIGGGLPVGALAGRDAVMEVFATGPAGSRLPHSGTFSANPLTMSAGLAAMTRYDSAAVARLNRLGDRARGAIAEAIAVAQAPATVTGSGSLLRVHMKRQAPTDYRSSFPTPLQKRALDLFIDGLYDGGVLPIYSGAGALSTAMDEADIEKLAEATLTSLRGARETLGDWSADA